LIEFDSLAVDAATLPSDELNLLTGHLGLLGMGKGLFGAKHESSTVGAAKRVDMLSNSIGNAFAHELGDQKRCNCILFEVCASKYALAVTSNPS
jgi:hypothetical protein